MKPKNPVYIMMSIENVTNKQDFPSTVLSLLEFFLKFELIFRLMLINENYSTLNQGGLD